VGEEPGADGRVQVKVPHLAIYLTIFVAVPLLTFLVGGAIDRALGLPLFPPFPWNLLAGLSVFLFGLWLGLKSTRLLYSMGDGLPWGEARSQDRTRKLVTTGVYAYTRNPMVIGYSLLPVGMGLMFQSPGMTVSISPIVFIVNILIVKLKEEPSMKARFGAEYIRYVEKTPFLFPHPNSLIRALSSSLNGRGAQLLFISISLAGLMILARLPFIDGVPQISLPSQKEVTGTLFIAVYALGLVAAVSPRSLRGLGHGSSSFRMVGHHPDCERFRDHVVWFNGHPLCAGCSGLAIGALMGIIGSVLYFFLGFPLFMPDVVFWLGVVSVALGLIQHFIDLDSPHVHILLNVALVCGSFMLASSLDARGASFYVEAYLLGLVVFWVAARIRVSQEEHILVCSACSEECDRVFRATH
jgi:protein-S-isoprenylcysteine O-methyltransferase Ste14